MEETEKTLSVSPCLRGGLPTVAWATEYRGDGNSFGYSVHNDEARAALVRLGVKIDPDAPVALHVAPAHLFRPHSTGTAGKVNILYTAWESTDLTPRFREGLTRADVVVVPAKFLARVIRREFPDKPVHYCPLGVHAEEFPFVDRERPTTCHRGHRESCWPGPGKSAGARRPSVSSVPSVAKPFRFLWVGAPNARKGWEVVLEAWRGLARLAAMGSRVPRAELYVKTSVTGRLEELPVPGARVVFDSRRLTRAELGELYASAHAFVFPSFGEGFGLTMAEAMSTGLPVLFTPWSAMTDLADESCGYPLRYKLIKHDLAENCNSNRRSTPMHADNGKGEVFNRRASACIGGSRIRGGGMPITFAEASAEDLLRRMLEVMSDYKTALRKGRLAARRIRRKFTWERTGETLLSIIKATARQPQMHADERR